MKSLIETLHSAKSDINDYMNELDTYCRELKINPEKDRESISFGHIIADFVDYPLTIPIILHDKEPLPLILPQIQLHLADGVSEYGLNTVRTDLGRTARYLHRRNIASEFSVLSMTTYKELARATHRLMPKTLCISDATYIPKDSLDGIRGAHNSFKARNDIPNERELKVTSLLTFTDVFIDRWKNYPLSSSSANNH